MLAIEIHYFRVAEPIVVPIAAERRADAETYFEDIKTTLIEAQRHGRRTLWLKPYDRHHEGLTVEPQEILRIHLVEHASGSRSADDPAA